MNRPRVISAMVAGGACLAIALGIWWGGRSGGPPLPAAARYPNLPERFDEVLRSARASVRSHRKDPEAVRKLAHLYQANGLYREARLCYELVAAIPPGLSARDHYLLADIAANEGDLTRAQTELQAVLAIEPRYTPARLALADTLVKAVRTEAAAKVYAAILASEVDQPQAAVGLARIELQRGDEESAAARLEELMAAHPESTSGAALFAQILERRGETDRAIAVRQLSLARPEPIPADPWMSELAADLFDIQRLASQYEEQVRTGQVEAAVASLRRIEEIDPKSPLPQMLRGRSGAQAHHDLEAVGQFRLALAKGGDPEKICPDLAQSLLALGRVSDAAELMAEYDARLPGSVALATAYADVALRKGDEKLARMLLERVLRKEPGLQPQNMALAKILWNSGERAAAVECLQRVAAADADDVPSRALLGEYFLGKADPFAAIGPLEQAIAKAPPKTPAQKSLAGLLGTAYLRAGEIETDRGLFEAAAEFFEKAIRLLPGDLNGYAGRARACVQLRQFGRAADALQKLALLDPENPTILLSLGDVVYQDGNADQARRHWQKARQLVAPGDSDLRDALDLRLSGRITAETFK